MIHLALQEWHAFAFLLLVLYFQQDRIRILVRLLG